MNGRGRPSRFVGVTIAPNPKAVSGRCADRGAMMLGDGRLSHVVYGGVTPMAREMFVNVSKAVH